MNLIKFTSAALAITMAFSFSPVFAADESNTVTDISSVPDSPNNNRPEYAGDSYRFPPTPLYKTDENGNYVGDIHVGVYRIEDPEIIKVIEDEKEVKEIIEKAGFEVPSDASITLLGAGNYYGKAFREPGEPVVDVTQPFELTVLLWSDLKVGDTVYVLHLKKDGNWEVAEGTVIYDGVVQVTLDGLSPVAFYKITQDGEIIQLTKAEAEQEAAHPGSVVSAKQMSTVRRSPNTGI